MAKAQPRHPTTGRFVPKAAAKPTKPKAGMPPKAMPKMPKAMKKQYT